VLSGKVVHVQMHWCRLNVSKLVMPHSANLDFCVTSVKKRLFLNVKLAVNIDSQYQHVLAC